MACRPTSQLTVSPAKPPPPLQLASARSPFHIAALCLFGFDEKGGNSLWASHPGSALECCSSHSAQDLAEICLPDGGHLREHDAASMLLAGRDGGRLYGYSCFRNVPDPSSPRGAKQMALLLVSNVPHLDMWRPFLVTALQACGADLGAAKRVLESLRHFLHAGFASGRPAVMGDDGHDGDPAKARATWYGVEYWGRTVAVQPPMLCEGELGGACLKDFVGVLRERIMLVWRAVLAESRVLLCHKTGSASAVSALVLASPLLVGELAPQILDCLEPYVTLAVLPRIASKSTFVAGCNNALFAERSEWWDVLVDVSTGSVWFHGGEDDDERPKHRRRPSTAEPLKRRAVCGMDMAFISKVLHGIHAQARSEAWVRSQFHDYTLGFLNRVGRRDTHMDALAAALAGLKGATSGGGVRGAGSRRGERLAEAFAASNLWQRYRTKRDAEWRGLGVLTPRGLRDSNAAPGLGAAAKRPSLCADRDWAVHVEDKSCAPYAMVFASGVSRVPTGFVSERVAAKPAAAAAPASSAWIQVQSPEGSYWWNVETNQTSWEIVG